MSDSKDLTDIEDILDRDNPKSVYNMVPESVKLGMEAIPRDYWLYTIPEFEKKWPENQVENSITSIIKRVRYAFWAEYNSAHLQNRGMQISKIISGVCSRSYFRDKIAPSPQRLAYILQAPENYKHTLTEIYELGLNQMLEILKADNYTKDKWGNEVFDSKLAQVKQKIWETSANRLLGGAVHRSLQVTENWNRELGAQNNTQGGNAELPNFSDMDPEKLEKFVESLKDSRESYRMDDIGEARELIEYSEDDGE